MIPLPEWKLLGLIGKRIDLASASAVEFRLSVGHQDGRGGPFGWWDDGIMLCIAACGWCAQGALQWKRAQLVIDSSCVPVSARFWGADKDHTSSKNLGEKPAE